MIAENIKKIKDSINSACSASGRNPEDIKLIAVSKNFGIEDIDKAIAEGLTDFGESKAQELDLKKDKTSKEVVWHFIGNLQRNKVRFVVDSAEYIHSVTSLMLAAEINKYAAKKGKIQKVLLQIKTSDEESKSGIESDSEILDLVSYCAGFPNIEAVGLMTIAPFTEDQNIIRNSFKQLKELQENLNDKGYNLNELSMGMTSDYKIAIEEGATMLRIGSAIFGERDYSKDWKES
jgi:PLP dependent protein